MQNLSFAKPVAVAGAVVVLWLAGAVADVARADAPGADSLTPGQIFRRAAERYAALTTYQDQGRVVSTVDGLTTTTAFVTRLARPGFYLLRWQHTRTFFNTTVSSPARAVYGSGAGDFLEVGHGPKNEGSPEVALDLASAASGGASAAIPMIFFRLSLENDLAGSGFGEQRLPDSKVGGLDCYVLTAKSRGRRETLWIGRRDFLIHQIETVVSAQSVRADLAVAANPDPEIVDLLQPSTFTETIMNIATDRPLSRADFFPSIPHFANPYDEQ